MKYILKKHKIAYWWPDIEFLKNHQKLRFRLTASLIDHSRKPRAQTKGCTATILRHNNKLTS